MATKVKPCRLNVTGTPQVGDVPVYYDEDTFEWGAGGGGGSGDVTGPNSSTDGDVVLFDGATGKVIKDSGVNLSSKLDASALSDTNYGGAWNGDTTHTPTKNAIYTKLHTMDVEIGNKAADNTVVKLSGNQTIAGTKTFSTSPVVPSKTTDATNDGTAIATEAQVYKKSEIVYATQAEYTALLPGAESDGKHYFIYTQSGGGGGWTPGVNTVLYLPLDGDVVDYSSAGRTFTVYGASASVGTPVFDTLANGKKVADFTASNDTSSNRFAFTSDVTNIPMSGNMTISFWMNWTGTTNGYQNIVTLRETSNYTWLTSIDIPSNSSKFMFHGSASEKTTFTPTTGTWYNMVCTVDNGTCYVYKDGVQIYSDSYTYGGASSKVCLCGYYLPSNTSYRSETYNGKLSEVIIENVAWSAQDVSDYYDLTKADYGIS